MAGPPNRKWRDVLGLNARTLDYIKRTNSAVATRIANNKLLTKRVLQKAGVVTPRLYAQIKTRKELKTFRWTKLPASYVLKPNAASGGGGIVVVFGRNKKGNWVKADKTELFIPTLTDHITDILDGRFSRGNVPDTAFFEQRLKVHPVFKPLSVRGVPDVRVLVYNNVPIMAMLRLPTEASDGRANLHAGGVGVGIDIVQGLTTTAVHHGTIIDTLPGTRTELSAIRIPNWPTIVRLAIKAAQAADLSFAGIDIAVDRDDGPMVLEINARPGLDIQFANMTPLKGRLRRVEGLSVSSPEKGVQVARSLFGDEFVADVEDISGRLVLGVEEEITLLNRENEPHMIKAKIDTGAWRTAIDSALAKKLGIDTPIDHKPVQAALGQATRPVIKLSFRLRDRLITTEAFIADRSHMKYEAIVGRRDLKGFLVDPHVTPPTSSVDAS